VRKRTKRKIWQLVNPIQHAIEGASMVPEKELDAMRSRELQAIDAFTRGTAGLQEWFDLTALLNLTETLALEGVGPEALEACGRAQAALIDAKERFERIQRMGMTGPGLQAMRDLYEYHDLQRQSIDRSSLERAIQKTVNKVKSRAPSVTVLT